MECLNHLAPHRTSTVLSACTFCDDKHACSMESLLGFLWCHDHLAGQEGEVGTTLPSSNKQLNEGTAKVAYIKKEKTCDYSLP